MPGSRTAQVAPSPSPRRTPTPCGAGRYAPSPTGDLHLGNLRTAMLAWLAARSSGRAFLLRIEDLDAGRVRPGVADRQRADLTALGLDFDGQPLIQSERAEIYAAALASLIDQTFECFCTRKEIAAAVSAPHGAVARYPGTCRELSTAERAKRRLSRDPALRLRASTAVHTISDALHGEVSGPVDDIVLRRNDGAPAYHLAVVVDDGHSGVDQVVRGDDLLPSAVSQAYLATQLGLRQPTYLHVPLVLNAAGQRLAKRDGAVTLADLRRAGRSVRDVVGALAASAGLAESGPVTLHDLLSGFTPERLRREPWHYPGRLAGGGAGPGIDGLSSLP